MRHRPIDHSISSSSSSLVSCSWRWRHVFIYMGAVGSMVWLQYHYALDAIGVGLDHHLVYQHPFRELGHIMGTLESTAQQQRRCDVVRPHGHNGTAYTMDKEADQIRNNSAAVDATAAAAAVVAVTSTTAAGSRRLEYVPTPTRDDLLVQYGDSIYSRGEWDGAPVVVEQYQLVFFTLAKVGCTIWKQLFRRMMGHVDWSEENSLSLLPWNPELNGLKYLYDYNRTEASVMMTSSNWTRAIMVREPMERFLSAYLDKALTHESFVKEKCCTFTGLCQETAKKSPAGFLEVIKHCPNAHWRPQSYRMEPKYWPYINFVGHMESIQNDAQQLLQHIGAWDEFGATGWGPYGNESIFQSKPGSIGRKHATDARQRLRAYIDPQLEQELKEFFYADYAHPVLNITELRLFA